MTPARPHPMADLIATLDLPPDLLDALGELTEPERAEVARQLEARLHARQLRARYPSPIHLATALDPEFVVTPALEVINYYLVRRQDDLCRRLIVNMGSQEGKSTIVSRWGNLWRLIVDPAARIQLGSYGASLSTDHAMWVRDMIEAHGLRATRSGGTDLLGLDVSRATRRRGEWTLLSRYVVGRRGGMLATGVRGKSVGRPADHYDVDDPYESEAAALSDAVQRGVFGWLEGVVFPRLPPTGSLTIIHTRWREGDVTDWMLAREAKSPPDDPADKIVHLNFPALGGQRSRGELIPDALHLAPGQWLTSARGRHLHDGAGWRKLRRESGARIWSAVYLGAPTPPGGGAFSADAINAYRVRRSAALALIGVFVDPGETGTADETGIVVAGRSAASHAYVLADASGLHDTAGWARRAHLTALEWDADRVVYEANRTPQGRKLLRQAWTELRRHALAAWDAAGRPDVARWPSHVDRDVCDRAAAALVKLGTDAGVLGDDGFGPAPDSPELTGEVGRVAEQIADEWPHVPRLMTRLPRHSIDHVNATRGKLVRAEWPAQQYQQGRVHHVGDFPTLEQQMTSWQQGMKSPDRMDAAVWAVTYLLDGSAPVIVLEPPSGTVATHTAGK